MKFVTSNPERRDKLQVTRQKSKSVTSDKLQVTSLKRASLPLACHLSRFCFTCHLSPVTVLVACHLLLVTPCAWAADALAEIEAAYLRGEYAAVIQQARRAAADPALPKRQDQVWYLLGLACLQLRQIPEAQEAFSHVIAEFPESPWRPDAEVALADAVWMSGDPTQAMSHYQAVLDRWGLESPIAARAQFQLGQAARAAGQWDTARTALQTLVSQFQETFEAELAQRILQEEEFAFAVQVGAFGVSANAERLRRELVRRGYTATVDRTMVEGRALHRVRVGRCANREEALKLAQQLNQDGFPGKVVP